MANLKTSTMRARLQRGKRYGTQIAPKVTLVYRRAARADLDGTWAARVRTLRGASPYELIALGNADDLTKPDGVGWLSYTQAVELALAKANVSRAAATLPLTVAEACADYIERRKERGTGRPKDDESMFKKYLGTLGEQRVSAIDHDILQAWARRAPRHAAVALRAALNATPVKVRPTSITLSALKEHRPVKRAGLIEAVMSESEVANVVAAARRHDHQFGLFIAVLAATGCRPGQIAQCRKADLLVRDAILVVPPSAKGKPGKLKPASRMPLDPALARELAAWVARKFGKELIFTLPRNVREAGGIGWKVEGERAWAKMDWGRAAAEAGIERRLYDLRHATVVRMLQNGVPIRLVAAKLDTSSTIIERVYSRFIGDTSDDLVRRALALKRFTVVT
jgi:integrase